MRLKIETLRTFSTVAQTGNLAEAADRLGRTTSAVSMTLKQLEGHLGQRLFESERKNRLTPLGEQVFDLAQNQLRQFDQTIDAIEMSARSPQGLLRIMSIPSVAGSVFPVALDAMSRRHPGLKVELRDTDTSGVVDALVQGEADIGIASGRHRLTGIRQTPLFEDRFGLICAPDHPLARQSDAPTIEQVWSAGFVRNALCALIETDAVRSKLPHTRVTVQNTLSLIGMIRTTNWVTILPRSVVRLAPEALAFRDIAGLADRRPVTMLLRERSRVFGLAEELAHEVEHFYQSPGTDAQGQLGQSNMANFSDRG